MTIEWSSACVELWEGDGLIAVTSMNRAHDREWEEPREAEYYGEMAQPIPPTITLPALAPGEYEV